VAGKLRVISSYLRSDFLAQPSSGGRTSKNKQKKSNKTQTSRRFKVAADACLTGMRQHSHLW